jgi:hypothetical protein
MLPATIGTCGSRARTSLTALIIDSWWRGVDDERVHARVEQLLGLARHVAVDAHRGGDTQLAVRVDGRGVQRGAQGALAGQDADEPALLVDGRGVAPVVVVEGVEGLARVYVRIQQEQVPGHDHLELGEAVDAGQVRVGDDADRPVVRVHDHAGVVRPLGQQRQGVGDRLVRGQHDRGVQHQVAALHPGDDVGDDVDRDVLRDDHQAAAAGHRLGHAASGDGGHVGDDERDGGARAVRRAEVHALTRAHRGAARHHEHVVVRQVVRGPDVIEETHVLHIPVDQR